MFSKTTIFFRNIGLVKDGVRYASSDVGFVGLGLMGNHMSRHLVKAGHKLVVFDISPAAVTGLTDAGARKVDGGSAEVAKNAGTVVTMLPSNQIVLDTYLGDNGLVKNAAPGSLLIDSSTCAPTVSQAISKAAKKRGVEFIDAPVSGGVVGARDATLTFMVGGTKENCERATPLLMKMGKNVAHCGDIGTGQAAKICNNMLLAISMIGVSECMNLGQRLGLEAKTLMDILNTSTGRCWSSEVYNPVPGLVPNIPPADNYNGGFMSKLMNKDLGLAEDAATSSLTPIPLGSMSHQIFKAMLVKGYGDKDFASVYHYLTQQSTK